MDRTSVIIGNILCLCAMITDSYSGTREKHSEIMAVQIVSQFFYAACSIVLKGYSSTVQNVVAVFSAVIMNYVGVLSCSVITVTTAVSLIRTREEEPHRES